MAAPEGVSVFCCMMLYINFNNVLYFFKVKKKKEEGKKKKRQKLKHLLGTDPYVLIDVATRMMAQYKVYRVGLTPDFGLTHTRKRQYGVGPC